MKFGDLVTHNFVVCALCIDSYDKHFSQTIATLPLLELINEIHSKKLNNMKMTLPHMKFPPLHEEVFPKKEDS